MNPYMYIYKKKIEQNNSSKRKSIIRNQNLELQKNIYIYSSFGPLASMHQLQTITFCSTW